MQRLSTFIIVHYKASPNIIIILYLILQINRTCIHPDFKSELYLKYKLSTHFKYKKETLYLDTESDVINYYQGKYIQRQRVYVCS